MKANLNRLFFITILSTTMVACSTNPVTDDRNTATGGYNTNTTSTNTTSTNTSNTNTSNTDGYTYSGGNSNINSEVDYSNNTNIPEVSYSNDTSYTTDTVNTPKNSAQKGFVVQLTASISEAKTDRIKNAFVADGYPVIQNSIQRNGQTLYRVQIGPYSTKAEAKRVFYALKNRYRHNPYVKSSFINENK